MSALPSTSNAMQKRDDTHETEDNPLVDEKNGLFADV
jgi:hypothetical protein